MCDLKRFKVAQEAKYDDALAEVKAGRKTSHWMWYIFPQFDGLGRSETSKFYSIKSLGEARAYLADELLGARLREISSALLDLETNDAQEVFGRTDAMKLKSCMTLFDLVSPDDVFAHVLDKFYEGKRSGRTLGLAKSIEQGYVPENAQYTPGNIRALRPDEVFVFGSNLAGRHAGGAARVAHKLFGAVYGQGVGLQGQSYGIPTMQGGVETIAPYVDEFISFAKAHPELKFYVTRIGCGIAGFHDEEIAPLFAAARQLPNVTLPHTFCEATDDGKA